MQIDTVPMLTFILFILFFSCLGCLKAVELNLDAFIDQGHSPTRGTDAWLLAVTVIDPSGLAAQVGGLQYHAAKNHFYLRRYVQYVLSPANTTSQRLH
jgi:hypothetical protein